MHVTLVDARVKADCINAFIEATHLNHEAPAKEYGNYRVDSLQLPEGTSHFILYETSNSAEYAGACKEPQHYLTVADWMTKPSQGIPFSALFPQ